LFGARVWSRLIYSSSKKLFLDALKKWVRTYSYFYLEDVGGKSIDPEKMLEMVEKADSDHDGRIDTEEFKDLVSNFMYEMSEEEFM